MSSVLTSILSCSAVLAHIILREKLHIFGILGCVLCVVGSTTIVLHAPQEREIQSVLEVWDLATDPGNMSLCHIFFIYLPTFCIRLGVMTYFLFLVMCSFSVLCCFGDNSCVCTYNPLHPSIWSDPYNGVHWSLLSCRFLIGMYRHLVVYNLLTVLCLYF